MATILLEIAYSKGLDQTYFSPFAKAALENKIPYQGGKNDDTTLILAEVVSREGVVERAVTEDL